MGFKKGMKREIAAYPSLKDERYFDGFKRSLFIVAKTHECNEVLDPTYIPGSEPEEQELFEAKQTFMFSVFNANLQTDMGKTIVRRHLATTDAQSVLKELSEHMRTSSKGASEKRRLTQYVTTTVLDDNFKGTTEQFVLHFNKQFRQLDEISEDSEKVPPTVKLTLLQTAVRSINDLRIVETLDEFQSTTYGHGSSTSLSYESYYDLLIHACVRYDKTKKANIGKRRNVYNKNIDETFRPYLGWVNVDTVQKTMEQSTQWGVSLPNTFPMKKHSKSRNPALNIPRRHEPVATDTVFSDTPAVDSGVKQAQVFVGRDTLEADAYPMKSGKPYVNTLEDNIRRRGAMDKLLSDSAKTEISNKVMDILRAYHISNWHSESYHQNQNPAEWRYRTIKSWTNTVMNRSGSPANCWFLCLLYVCHLLNHISYTALDGKIPLLVLTAITPDISIILLFTFYQPVFYATYDQNFPSKSEERAGYWVGFGEHCGDAMTPKILDHETPENYL